jgi:hypothetical protein
MLSQDFRLARNAPIETCRQVLDHYVKLEPILNSEEDQPVTVQAGFDPAPVKLIGKVAGDRIRVQAMHYRFIGSTRVHQEARRLQA